jgi:prepilin-type N-terminal cleavage/methylation domain-containing protein
VSRRAVRPDGSLDKPFARAFTLIEVTAVLVLSALLAGAAVVLLAGPRARAAAVDAVDQLSFADGQVRRLAVASDAPQALTIDIANGRLLRSTDEAAPVVLADLPAGVRVTRVLLGNDVIDFGLARVPVSAGGLSRSYAVGLSTPAGPRWVVVAGLTGRATAVPDAAAADAALEPVRSADEP